MLEQLIKPLIVERHRNLHQIHNDSGEVDVNDNHHVKVTEQLQLLQIDRRLAIGLLGLLQVTN